WGRHRACHGLGRATQDPPAHDRASPGPRRLARVDTAADPRWRRRGGAQSPRLLHRPCRPHGLPPLRRAPVADRLRGGRERLQDPDPGPRETSRHALEPRRRPDRRLPARTPSLRPLGSLLANPPSTPPTAHRPPSSCIPPTSRLACRLTPLIWGGPRLLYTLDTPPGRR